MNTLKPTKTERREEAAIRRTCRQLRFSTIRMQLKAHFTATDEGRRWYRSRANLMGGVRQALLIALEPLDRCFYHHSIIQSSLQILRFTREKIGPANSDYHVIENAIARLEQYAIHPNPTTSTR